MDYFLNTNTGTIHKVDGEFTYCKKELINGKFVSSPKKGARTRQCSLCFGTSKDSYIYYTCNTCGEPEGFSQLRTTSYFVCRSCSIKHRNKTRELRKEAESVKRRILKERGAVCETCGARGGTIDMHHIKKLTDGGDNSDSNLLLLCKKCHKKAHAKGNHRSIKFWMGE